LQIERGVQSLSLKIIFFLLSKCLAELLLDDSDLSLHLEHGVSLAADFLSKRLNAISRERSRLVLASELSEVLHCLSNLFLIDG